MKHEINHANIPEDLEYDQDIKLWRYMNITSLFKILQSNEIPLINISKFSDKSEGAILKQILYNLPHATELSVSYAMQLYYRTTYVSSWYSVKYENDRAEYENASMWERYTHYSEGVAIQTNAKLLWDCIKRNINWLTNDDPKSPKYGVLTCVPQTFIKPIEYTLLSPKDFRMNNDGLETGLDRMCFFYKMADYADESEVRILKSFSCPIHRSMLGADKLTLKYLHDFEKRIQDYMQDVMPLNIDSARDFIEKIVISPDAHTGTLKTLKKLCEEWINPDIIVESRRKEWLK